MYKAYVTELANVRPHPNADRMLLADCFGNTICVGLDAKNGDIGIYFPVDGQLSEEYCKENDLVRRKDENGNAAGGYLDPDKRNIKAIKLRGEKSDGLFMPLSSLTYTGVDINSFKVGDIITEVNGKTICVKYVPLTQVKHTTKQGNYVRKHKAPIAPLFFEHADTEQLVYNIADFRPGDQIEITLKMHGTSGRTGYLPKLQGYKRTLLDKIFKREGTPQYAYGYVTGTRRTVLENFDDSGFYGTNGFREEVAKQFEGKLWKGETVYYEIVGFTDTNAPIMAIADNKSLGKDFIKQYGTATVFSYGCEVDNDEKPLFDVYVYRMTMTNEDGEVVEYAPDFMRYRCDQMGIKTVPVFYKGFIRDDLKTEDFVADNNGNFIEWIYAENVGEWVKNKAEQYYDGTDPVGKTHIREGVVVRIVNRPKFTAYKHKNFSFKVLSGIAIANAEANGSLEAMSADQREEL